jgi:hypothetical protein
MMDLKNTLAMIERILGVEPQDEFFHFVRTFEIARQAPWHSPATAAMIEVRCKPSPDNNGRAVIDVTVTAVSAMSGDVGTLARYAASLQHAVTLATEVEALTMLDWDIAQFRALAGSDA